MPENNLTKIMESGNQWQPRKSDNPWKRNCCHGQSEVYRRMLGILNRVTKSSIQVLLEQALVLPLAEPEHLEEILSLLLNKVQDEPLFVPTYARFCGELVARINIGDSLAAACENHFQDRYQQLLTYPDTSDGVLPPLPVIKEEFNLRRQLIVTIGFVVELSKLSVVPISQVILMGRNILSNDDRRSLECLCRIYTFGGETLTRNDPILVEESFTYIENRLNEGNLPLRLKFLLEDTIALRVNNWRRLPHQNVPFNNTPNRSVRG